MSGELGFLDCLLHDPMYGSEMITDDDFNAGKMDLLSTSLHENGLLQSSQNNEVHPAQGQGYFVVSLL